MSPANAARLLIADDDPDMLAVSAVFFRNQGFDVRTAVNGADALTEYLAWYPARYCSISKCRVLMAAR
jgi:CheY-like chemotaxis protein